VRLEIETAFRKNKPLIPVLVSRAVMPPQDELPDSLHDFSYLNAVQVESGQDFDIHIGRLIRAVEAVPRIEPPPTAEPPVAPVAPPGGWLPGNWRPHRRLGDWISARLPSGRQASTNRTSRRRILPMTASAQPSKGSWS
jgi:hypothetical protein